MRLPEKLKVLEYRDFRLMWTGAFLSFVGSWIQNFAQGYLVYDLTHSKEKLALIGFVGNLPIFLLGPFAGAVTDAMDRKKALIICQLVFGFTALFLCWAITVKNVTFNDFLVVALINGVTGAIEMPARQSVVGKTVPPELVSSAVPFTATTFNLARIIGPVIGALVLLHFGNAACYFLNSISYIALVFAVLAVKSEMSSGPREPQPVRDLLMEGVLYTLRNPTLKLLLILETVVSMFAVCYINMLPAFTKDILHQGAEGLSKAMTAIGFGALAGLSMMIWQSQNKNKIPFIFLAMGVLGAALVVVSLVHIVWIAYICFFFTGFGTLVHFNTTNALFQTLSPDRLRGRVLAMHVWALSGIGPMFLPVIGRFAEIYHVDQAFLWGAAVTLVGWAIGLLVFLRGQSRTIAKYVQ